MSSFQKVQVISTVLSASPEVPCFPFLNEYCNLSNNLEEQNFLIDREVIAHKSVHGAQKYIDSQLGKEFY